MANYTGDIITSGANTGFMADEKFISAYLECVKSDAGRLLGSDSSYDIRWRIHTLLWAAKYAEKLTGDFVDCGAGFGLFASSILSYINLEGSNKKYYLIDTFDGLSNKYSSDFEIKRTGNSYTKHSSWHDEVIQKFSKYNNSIIIKGTIPDILSSIKIKEISFMSIDLNSTIPEKEALEYFWPKITNGGIIIFDDYGFPGHESQKESHDEFAAKNNLIIYTSPTGQGILIKP